MSTVLIAGCGYVGGALGVRLAEEGISVAGLRRNPGDLPPSIRGVSGDVTRPESLDGLPENVDAVVYAVSADASTEDAYRAAYVRGPGAVLDALERCGGLPRRLLFVSSTAVYGVTDGAWVDEDSPTEPLDFRGRILLEGEEATRAGPVPVTVVRLGGIYGPGRTRLVDRVRAGEARCPPDPPRWTNRIHRDDAAGILAHLLAADEPEPVYLGVDLEPSPRCQVLRWIAERAGAPEPPRARQEERSGRRRANKRCSSERIRAAGYRFRYPTFREGYAPLI